MTVGRAQRVVGLHVIGPMADEMIQGFAVAVRMGCTVRARGSPSLARRRASRRVADRAQTRPFRRRFPPQVRDLHACVAIHPAMSEEAVTIKWGKDAANETVALPPYLDRRFAPGAAASAAGALALAGAVAALAFAAGRLSRR